MIKMGKTRTKKTSNRRGRIYNTCGKFPDCPSNNYSMFSQVCLVCGNHPDIENRNLVIKSGTKTIEEFTVWKTKQNKEAKEDIKQMKKEGWITSSKDKN